VRVLAIIAAALGLQSQPTLPSYSEGQVWEYRVRPGDVGSLLKIQRIEQRPELGDLNPVYHVSVIGFRLQNPQIAPALAHAPVSKETLDKSVIRIAKSDAVFPSVDAGIEEWKNNSEGLGIFTISIAEIVDLLDRSSAGQSNAAP
jgi:hypothetical protein